MNRIACQEAEKKFAYHSIYGIYYNILLYVKSNNIGRIK